jgi:hypothetical protein
VARAQRGDGDAAERARSGRRRGPPAPAEVLHNLALYLVRSGAAGGGGGGESRGRRAGRRLVAPILVPAGQRLLPGPAPSRRRGTRCSAPSSSSPITPRRATSSGSCCPPSAISVVPCVRPSRRSSSTPSSRPPLSAAHRRGVRGRTGGGAGPDAGRAGAARHGHPPFPVRAGSALDRAFDELGPRPGAEPPTGQETIWPGPTRGAPPGPATPSRRARRQRGGRPRRPIRMDSSLQGTIFLQRGLAGEALERFDAALAARPTTPTPPLGRGRALLELGRPAHAVTAAEEAVRVHADGADVLLGRALLAAGHTARAVGWFESGRAGRRGYRRAFRIRRRTPRLRPARGRGRRVPARSGPHSRQPWLRGWASLPP